MIKNINNCPGCGGKAAINEESHLNKFSIMCADVINNAEPKCNFNFAALGGTRNIAVAIWNENVKKIVRGSAKTIGQLETGGRDDLWLWFNLSYASFAVLPRILMHEMPDKWQRDMAKLLNELDEAFPNMPELDYLVQAKKNNRFTSFPSWMLNYKYPDYAEIEKARGKSDVSSSK